MGTPLFESDKSIKPKHMLVGDVIVGHHEGNPAVSPFELHKRRPVSLAPEPHEIIRIVRPDQEGRMGMLAGVYYLDGSTGIRRYSNYVVRTELWLIVRDRPGIPRFISEYPAVCLTCKGRIYVGLREVVHELRSCIA